MRKIEKRRTTILYHGLSRLFRDIFTKQKVLKECKPLTIWHGTVNDGKHRRAVADTAGRKLLTLSQTCLLESSLQRRDSDENSDVADADHAKR